MASWRATKDACDFCSDRKFRATVMSTMLPDEMLGGRRMEGNSICREEQSSVRWPGKGDGNSLRRAIQGFIQVFCLQSTGLRRLHRPCRRSARSAWWIVNLAGVEAEDDDVVDKDSKVVRACDVNS
jgi:hypothetical protein